MLLATLHIAHYRGGGAYGNRRNMGSRWRHIVARAQRIEETYFGEKRAGGYGSRIEADAMSIASALGNGINESIISWHRFGISVAHFMGQGKASSKTEAGRAAAKRLTPYTL